MKSVKNSRIRRSLALAATAALLTAGLAACSGQTAAAPTGGGDDAPRKFVIASGITGANFLAVYAGLEQGIFEKHGIDLEVVPVATSADASSASLSGSADASAVVADSAIALGSSGTDFRLIGGLLKNLQFTLITRPDIKTVEDLKGKTIATQGKGASEYIVRYVLRDAGLDDETDVQWVSMGNQTSELAAIVADQIQGYAAVPPYDVQAKSQGMNVLLYFKDVLPQLPTASIAAPGAALEKNSELYKDFLAALVESTNWVIDNPDDAVQVLMRASDIDEASAKAAFDETLPLYNETGVIDDAGMKTWMKLDNEYGGIANFDYTKSYDNSYLPSH